MEATASDEKGVTSEVEVPSTDTTHVNEVESGVQELPEVGMPEIESSEMVAPSKNQKRVRDVSEKKLKQLENARAQRKKNKLNVENSLSLLKEDYEGFKQKAGESEKEWQSRFSEMKSTYDQKVEALESELKRRDMVTAQAPPAQPVFSTPPARNNFPVHDGRAFTQTPDRPFVYF